MDAERQPWGGFRKREYGELLKHHRLKQEITPASRDFLLAKEKQSVMEMHRRSLAIGAKSVVVSGDINPQVISPSAEEGSTSPFSLRSFKDVITPHISRKLKEAMQKASKKHHSTSPRNSLPPPPPRCSDNSAHVGPETGSPSNLPGDGYAAGSRSFVDAAVEQSSSPSSLSSNISDNGDSRPRFSDRKQIHSSKRKCGAHISKESANQYKSAAPGLVRRAAKPKIDVQKTRGRATKVQTRSLRPKGFPGRETKLGIYKLNFGGDHQEQVEEILAAPPVPTQAQNVPSRPDIQLRGHDVKSIASRVSKHWGLNSVKKKVHLTELSTAERQSLSDYSNLDIARPKKRHVNFLKRGQGEERKGHHNHQNPVSRKSTHPMISIQDLDPRVHENTTREENISYVNKRKNNHYDTTASSTRSRERERDLDMHDYQGGDGELDEIIRRWKQRRGDGGENVSKRQTDGVPQSIYEAPNSSFARTPDIIAPRMSHTPSSMYATPPSNYNCVFQSKSAHEKDPPWRRPIKHKKAYERRLQIVRSSHGGPPQWFLQNGHWAGGSMRHPGTMSITSAQAAIIFCQTKTFERTFFALRDYADRRRWEEAAVAAICERRAEAHVPTVLDHWRSLFKAVRWYRLRTLSIFIDCWAIYTADKKNSHAAMLKAHVYFELRHGLFAVRRWREYACRRTVLSEWRGLAYAHWKKHLLLKMFRKFARKVQALKEYQRKSDSAEKKLIQNMMRKYFHVLKETTSASLLEEVMEARRNGVLVRKCFVAWTNITDQEEDKEGQLIKATLYARLLTLGNAFWRWDSFAKTLMSQKLSALHWDFRSKSTAAKRWLNFVLERKTRRKGNELAIAMHRQRVHSVHFVRWRRNVKFHRAEEKGAMYYHLKIAVDGLAKWLDFVDSKRASRRKARLAQAHFKQKLWKCWVLYTIFSLKKKAAIAHWQRSAARRGVKWLHEFTQAAIQQRAHEYVADTFARRSLAKWTLKSWQDGVDAINSFKAKESVAVLKYNQSLTLNAIRMLRLEINSSKEMNALALALRRTFEAAMVCRLLRFWNWYAHRDRALRQYFFHRRVAVIFVAWRHYLELRRMEKESHLLAKLHFRGTCLKKHMAAWKDVAVTLLIRREVVRGAVAWGNRKLMLRKLRLWHLVVQQRSIFRGKYRMADAFHRLVVINRCLLHWHNVVLLANDHYH